MNRFLLPLAITLLSATPPMADTITITGQNGGTLHGVRSCSGGSSQATCTFNATTTTPAGLTGTRARVTHYTQGTVTSTLTGTRPGGRSFGRTATITR